MNNPLTTYYNSMYNIHNELYRCSNIEIATSYYILLQNVL